jgi:gamma-glutamylcyclotransferase (GGCT)/AIG2-like uncharacterized protein YtfP
VIGRALHGASASLQGFAVLHIRGEVYPGIVPSPGSTAPGKLYRDVTLPELEVLDRFEGGLYRRERRIVTVDSGQRTGAWVYRVAAGRKNMLTARPWLLDRFLRTGYQRFLRRFVRDRRALYAMDSE